MKKILGTLTIAVFIVGVALAAHAAPYQDVNPMTDPEDILLFGSEYDLISSGWFTPAPGVLGNIWAANSGTWVEYTANLEAGNWNIGINAIPALYSAGTFPPAYFQFEVYNTLTGTTITIPAEVGVVNYGFINVDIPSLADYTIRYTWLNDAYYNDGNGYIIDANIQINDAFFDYNPVPIPGALLLLGSGLAGLGVIRRRINQA